MANYDYMGPVADRSPAPAPPPAAPPNPNAGGLTSPRQDNPLTAPAPQQPDWMHAFQSTQAPKLSGMNPYTDLGYNSFLRGYGLQQNQINSQVARQKAGLESQLEAQRPAWADTLSRGLKNIAGNAEANGVFASGQRLQNQDEFQVDQSRAQNNYESGIHGQENDLQAQAQSQLLDLARQRAEQELAARQRLASESMTNGGSNPQLMAYVQSLLQGG